MNRIFFVGVVFAASSIVVCRADAGEPSVIERWDRAVCLFEQSGSSGDQKSGQAGSGFLTSVDDKILLVTAAHVARFTTKQSKLLIRNPLGETRWALLSGLATAAGEPWRFHGTSDLAAMNVSLDKLDPNTAEAVVSLAIPLSALTETMPPRSTAIEIAGFPLLMGLAPSISPLVMNAHLASRELDVDAKWGKERVVFAFPVVGDGTSGGPVFLPSVDHGEPVIVGMYVGYYSDNTGPKLAKLVPAPLIREWLGGLNKASLETPAP